jgi:ribonuclease HI
VPQPSRSPGRLLTHTFTHPQTILICPASVPTPMTGEVGGAPRGVLHLFTDGACSGNPGPAAAAWLVVEPRTNVLLLETGEYLGNKTNNEAEYTAIVRGMEECIANRYEVVRVLSDSQLCVRQINGGYRVKEPRLRQFHDKVINLKTVFKDIEFTWVARENEWTARCDKLAKSIIVDHIKGQG